MTDRRALARGPDRRQQDRRAPLLPGIILRAATDDTLLPRDVHVYLALFHELDVLEYRPVKHTWLAKRVRLSRSRVWYSIGRLVAGGYLECSQPGTISREGGGRFAKGSSAGPRVRTYRLASREVEIIPRDLEAEALRDALREISHQASMKAANESGRHRADLQELGRQCVWAARASELREAAA